MPNSITTIQFDGGKYNELPLNSLLFYKREIMFHNLKFDLLNLPINVTQIKLKKIKKTFKKNPI